MKKIIKILLFTIIISFMVNYNSTKATNETELTENGTYEIYTCVSDTKVVGVSNENVCINERENKASQKFRLQKNEDGTYTIRAVHSNKVLDVCGAEAKNGANVWQYAQNGSDAQKWYIEPLGNGTYSIISKLKGLYLDIYCGYSNNGTNIQIYQGNGSKAQKFNIVKVQDTGTKTIEDGIYNIYSKVTTNRVLQVDNKSTSNGASIKTTTSEDMANQKFNVKYNNDGTYTITAMHSGKVLDVAGADGKNGATVQQYQSNNSNAQKWFIQKNQDGTYTIISKCNNLVLDITGGSISTGAKVQTYRLNGSNAQKFTFEPCKQEQGTQSAEDGTYRIMNINNKEKVFSISGNSILQMNTDTKNSNQRYELQYDGNGYYKIKHKNTNNVLTVESENPRIGSNITEQNDNNLDTQKWILKKHSESIYSIISKCGNLYIDTLTSNIQNNHKLQLKTQTDLPTQQFILINQTPKANIKTNLENGVYQIETTGTTVIDISGGSQSNGANVQVWKNEKVQQQKFHITKINNTDYYKITAVHSAKVLDVVGGSTSIETNVNQYSYNGTDSQQWLLKDCNNGYYNIIAANGLYLDITSGLVNSSGSNVQLYYNNGSNAQKFKITPINIINNNTYEIETKLNSNKVVDISGGSTAEKANLQLWSASNVNQQRFQIEALPGTKSIYKIIAKHSNKALTVDTNTNNVYQTTYTGTPAQQWEITEAGGDYYYIVSKQNGYVLDVNGAITNDGQNVGVYQKNGSNAQKFRFVTGYRKFYEEGTYGKSGLLQIGDSRGTNLKYYKLGRGSKVLFTTFSIHGFEDSYAHDGSELTFMANEFKNYILNNADESIINNWTIYILPCLNPDGQTHGWTNNGPGRCTVYQGIDMNRNWSVGFKVDRSSRNNTGNQPFSAHETAKLRDFITSHQGSKNILIDVHGWLNETIGDRGLAQHYIDNFGLPNHINSYGAGYLVNWARQLTNGRSVLVELPEVSNHSQVQQRNYAGKFNNATMGILRTN